MADIFVCYSRQDIDKAHSIASELEARGWSVSWDHRIPPGQEVNTFVKAQLDAARCIVVLWSKAAIDSDWVREEAAEGMDGRLVPVRLENVRPPLGFGKFDTADLSDWAGDERHPGFEAFLAGVRSKVPMPQRNTAKLAPVSSAVSVPPRPQPTETSRHTRPIKAATPSQAKSSVFLCYRRDDTQDAAGRLYDRLEHHYGPEHIFMDIDSLPLGVDFVDHVSEQLAGCTAVIVMIGRQWLTVTDKRGRRRLDLEDDLVRAEISAALQRRIPVIPVLVQDAGMPSADELPDNIRPLARRNGIDLSGPAWRAGVERLIKELDRVMKPSSGS